LTSAALCIATGAFAEQHAMESPVAGEPMADEMTIVSWGGAYQESQLKAYVEPYLEMNPDVTVTWDESSAEAVAQLRAMNEAGNLSWDLVDVTAADAMRLCDEGIAMEVDIDEVAAPAPDGTPASEDFGEDMLVSDCFIPQIAYSYTFGYRTDVEEWNGAEPEDICAVFDTETFPGQRSLERRPIGNLEWALICDGVAMEDVYDVLETEEGIEQAFAMLDTIRSPKSSEAGVPSGAAARISSWSTSIARPSSQRRMASEATTSTRSQVMLPASSMARRRATASAELSSQMISTPGFISA
jgi:putative spermidine/putrescine transport system substrate-binding protein